MFEEFLYKMAEKVQADGVQSRQVVFVRYCLKSSGYVKFIIGGEQ